MKLDITKEWFERRVALEGDHEIGAGSPISNGGAMPAKPDGQDANALEDKTADATAPGGIEDE